MINYNLIYFCTILVSLSDSLNSTLDTKPAGSRDMQPIPEDRDAEERATKNPAKDVAKQSYESQEEDTSDADDDHPGATETTSKYGTEATSKWPRDTGESTSKWETGKTLPGTGKDPSSQDRSSVHARVS